MKKIIIPIIAFVFVLNSGCSSTSYTYRSVDITKDDVIAQQVVVDLKLDLKNRITTTSSKRNSVDEAVEEAYYKAIVDNNIDVVVDPIFEVKSTDKILFFGGKSTAKLTGFGAKYDNARNKLEAVKELKSIDTTDVKNFDALYGSSIKSKSKSNKPANTMKKKWWLWGALGAALYFLVLK
jgi:hypothetical protein